MRLLPWASVCFALYSVGFPAVVGWVVVSQVPTRSFYNCNVA
jgi:hypothetical protein